MYDNFNRVPVQRVEAGDICAFSGLSDASIGETINNPDHINPLPTIAVSSAALATKRRLCASLQSYSVQIQSRCGWLCSLTLLVLFAPVSCMPC